MKKKSDIIREVETLNINTVHKALDMYLESSLKELLSKLSGGESKDELSQKFDKFYKRKESQI